VNHDSLFLIVDDDPDMCWALEYLLHRQGIETRTAANGHQALALLAVHPFQIALVDMKLPDMEGLELAKRIHSNNTEIRIVIISGYCYRYDAAIRNAMSTGLIDDFTAKPFQHPDVLKTITRLMRGVRLLKL
jgi:DNA-binding NtrC family response regulator